MTDSIAETAETAAVKMSETVQHNLLHWDDLPAWMQVDPYVRRGYRRPLSGFCACIRSLFHPHNELVNTWSHLVPAVVYIAMLLGVDIKILRYDLTFVDVADSDKRIVQIYIVGTVICLLSSALFHGASAHSEVVSTRLLKLDYLGICFSISVTNLSSTFFGLYHYPWLRMVYNSFCLACALAVLLSMMGKGADGPGAALFRISTFLALMLSGCVPIAHMFITQGFEGARQFPLMHTALMGIFYLLGTCFYASHWPEKAWPEKFDIWGASHQTFHAFTALGQFVFLLGLREALLKRYV